jgi:hypothetical protein
MNRVRRHAILIVALAVATSVGSTAAGTSPAHPYVIQADIRIAGLAFGPATPRDAARRFGQPNTSRADTSGACTQSWRALGLVLLFLDLYAPAPCATGRLAGATVTNASRWRTSVGLRVGDTTSRVRRLYPHATLHAGGSGNWNGYWLVTRHVCAEVGGSAYPALLARVRAGRVSALVVSPGVCE